MNMVLYFRLERVITRMMRTLPVLSSSEKKMMQELEAMQTHIPVFLNQLRQIKEKEKLTSQVRISILYLACCHEILKRIIIITLKQFITFGVELFARWKCGRHQKHQEGNRSAVYLRASLRLSVKLCPKSKYSTASSLLCLQLGPWFVRGATSLQ